MEIAVSDADINACFSVMQALRPHLREETFLDEVRAMQAEGFQLAFVKAGDEVATVAGYRISLSFAAQGKALYVYDLSTAEKYRSQGYGTQMINALKDLCQQEGCKVLHLDSGVHRHAAHRFYLVNGFDITAHHFLITVS